MGSDQKEKSTIGRTGEYTLSESAKAEAEAKAKAAARQLKQTAESA